MWGSNCASKDLQHIHQVRLIQDAFTGPFLSQILKLQSICHLHKSVDIKRTLERCRYPVMTRYVVDIEGVLVMQFGSGTAKAFECICVRFQDFVRTSFLHAQRGAILELL